MYPLQFLDPVSALLFPDDFLDSGDYGVAVADALWVGGEPGIVQQLLASGQFQKTLELFVVVGGQDDESVGGLEGLVGNGVGMRCPQAFGHLAAGKVVEALVE